MTTLVKQYFDDLTQELTRESERIRSFFATHRPSGGLNREDVTASLLRKHIIPLASIETGLILSASGEFSNQTDLILIDRQHNTPLHGSRPIPLWLVESVFGAIEVKTSLTAGELADSVKKCRRFKLLPRNYADSPNRTIGESLFCIWAFEAPSTPKLISNIKSALEGVTTAEQPDFIIVPGQFLFVGGHYRELAAIGQPNSQYWADKLSEQNKISGEPKYEKQMYYELNENT